MTVPQSEEGFSDTPPISEGEAEEVLSDIREWRDQQREQTPDGEATKLRRMQDRILESLDDASHVIPELLQNADDVGGACTSATIRLTRDALVVENHGGRMTASEVAALGEFTRSTKRDLSYIGHFGIGFKTVFSVTDTPHVRTGHASFRYERAQPERPVSERANEFEGTQIRLPFREDLPETRRAAIREKLDSIERLLPFLNNLETITVENLGETTVYERHSTDIGTRIIRKRSPHEEDGDIIARYRLFSESLDTDSEIFEMLAEEREFEAEDLSDRTVELTVSVAIPISEDGVPIPHTDSRLFCYFPTSQNTDLPFDVQADFLLKSDREQIRPGHPLNEQFLETAGLLVEDAISEFQSMGVDAKALIELVPDATKDRPGYLSPLLEQTYDAISKAKIVPGAFGGLHRPSEVVILPEALRSAIPLVKFGQQFSGAAAHPDPDLDSGEYDRLEALESTTVLSVGDALEELRGMALLGELSTTDIVEVLSEVYQYVGGLRTYRSEEEAEYKRILAALRSLPLFAVQDQSSVTVRRALDAVDGRVYRPTRQDESVYEPFYNDLNLLSGDLIRELRSSKEISDTTAGQVRDLFADHLEIEVLSHRDIVNEVVNSAYEEPGDHSDTKLDSYLEYLQKHAQKYLDECDIRLRGADGVYRDPTDLYLPTAYNEERFASSLLFGAVTERRPLSESYLECLSDEVETGEWREFFAKLGVQNHIPVSEDVDQCTKETFDTGDELREFLDTHDDEGTDVQKDKHTVPYGGRNCSWMRATEARHGLVDQGFTETFEERLKKALEANPELGVAFTNMLDTHWESIYAECVYREYYFSVQDNGFATRTETSRCPTTFTEFLRSTDWLPGDDDALYRPSHLFKRNPVTEDAGVTLLSEAVAPLSRDLLEVLNVREDVGIAEHRIGLEQVVANREARDPDIVDREIRSYLHSFADQVEEATSEDVAEAVAQLNDCPFIYVPDASPEFRTVGQVAWSTGLGNHIEPIKTYYRGFHNLFVEVFDVPPEPTFETYLDFFQYADTDRWGPVEEAWREIPRRIIRDSSLEWEIEEIAARLQETDAIPNANRRIVSYDEIEYIAEREGVAESLPESIADSVALPSYDQRFDRGQVVDLLSSILDATHLDEALERNVVHPEYENTSTTLYSSFGECLDVGNSVLAERDSVTAAAIQQLAEIAGYSLQGSPQIQCEYRLRGKQKVAAHGESVYIDTEKEHIVIRETDAASLDLVDAITATLGLTGGDKTEFTNLVKGAIGKSPELVDAYLTGEDLEHSPLLTDGPRARDEKSDSGNEAEGDSTTDNSGIKRSGPTTSTWSADDGTERAITDSGKSPSEVGEGTTTPLNGSSRTETDEPWQRTESWASPKAGSDVNTSPASPTPPVREPSSGGGGGTDSNETGRKGEESVMDYLRTLITEAIETDSTVSTLQNGYRIQGADRERERRVDVQFVPDKSDPHCDILVTGAALSRDGDQLVVANVAEDDQALVEVKSTESRSQTFTLSGPEHRDAQAHPDTYYIARVVQVGGEDEHLHKVFDSVPEIGINKGLDDRLSIENCTYDVTLSY